MLSGLVLLLLIIGSQNSFGSLDEKLSSISESKQWRKLLYFDNSKSLIVSSRYFISSNGRSNPEQELKASYNAFHKKLKNAEGFYYQCLFPARMTFIEKTLSIKFSKVECPDFKEWREGLDISNVYLAFTSAYPNNPASMFGHTYLRFDRKSRGELKATKELIGYSMAFQAATDSKDNALVYTMKGLLGGYNSHLEVKPNYINMGIYNNGESRDIWEYKLNFTSLEIEKLIEHSWELARAGAFDYYFFDENCSTHILQLLEVIRPEIDFNTKNELFVVPQVSLREVVKKFGNSSGVIKLSIKKKIKLQLEKFNEDQKKQFILALNDRKEIEKTSDILVLDTLADYWKFINYDKNTELEEVQATLMYETLLTRSKLKLKSKKNKVEGDRYEMEDPILGHKMSLLGASLGDSLHGLRARYGFHDFKDSELGYDGNSFIKFMDIDYIKKNNQENFNIDLIDILSLQEYNFLFSSLSWRARLKHLKNDEKNGEVLEGGVGTSKRFKKTHIYTLINSSFFNLKERGQVLVGGDIGVKYFLAHKLKYVLLAQVYSEGLGPIFENSLVYDLSSHSQLSLVHKSENNTENYSLSYGLYF